MFNHRGKVDKCKLPTLKVLRIFSILVETRGKRTFLLYSVTRNNYTVHLIYVRIKKLDTRHKLELSNPYIFAT